MSIPEGYSNTLPQIQYDANLSGMQASILSTSRALQESLLLNSALNQANTSIEEEQFKHSFNAVNLEPPKTLTATGTSISRLSDLVDATIEKELRALPQPLQDALRKNIAQNNIDSKAFDDYFTEAGGVDAGYEALVKAHFAAMDAGEDMTVAPDKLSELREMIYMYALVQVAGTIPPTEAPPPTTIQLKPALSGALRALQMTEKGAVGLINAQIQAEAAEPGKVGYGEYLGTVMAALHNAIAELQKIQVADAKVSQQFAISIKTMADVALEKGLKAIAEKKAAAAAAAEQAEEQKKSDMISLIVLIVTIVVAVVSIAVTLGTAAIAASAAAGAAATAAGGAAAGGAAATAGTAATIGGTGLTLGQMVMIGVDIAGIVIASVDYGTNSAITNALTAGFADFASSLGMSQEALAAVIVGLAILLFIITKGAAKLTPFKSLIARQAATEGAKGITGHLATLGAKNVARSVAINMAIPLLMMSGVMTSFARGIAEILCPNDKDAQDQATMGLTIALMFFTMGCIMGGPAALFRGGKKLFTGLKAIGKGGDEAVKGVVNVGEEVVVAGVQQGGGAIRGAGQGGAAVGEGLEGAGQAMAGSGKGSGKAAQAVARAEGAANDAADAVEAVEVPADNVVVAARSAAGGDGAPEAAAAANAAGDAEPAVKVAEDAANVQVPATPTPPAPGSAAGKAADAAQDVSAAKSPAEEVEAAKAALREVDTQIESAEKVMENLGKQLARAEETLKQLDPLDPKNMQAIKDAVEIQKNVEQQMKQVTASLKTLKEEKKLLEETLEAAMTKAGQESAKVTQAAVEKRAIYQILTSSIQILGTLTEGSMDIYQYATLMQMSDLEKLITKFQSDEIKYQADQLRIQTVMKKLQTDRDMFMNLVDSSNTAMQGLYETGNALLSALQSGGNAIFSR